MSDTTRAVLLQLVEELKAEGLLRRDVSLVVCQAQDDLTLPPAARSLMWFIGKRLTLHEFREVYTDSIAVEAGMKDVTAGQMLKLLVHRGYLEEHQKRRPRAYRLPVSRRTSTARVA